MSRADYEVLAGLAHRGLLEVSSPEGRLRAEATVRDLLDTLARVRDERNCALAEVATLSKKLDSLHNSLVLFDGRALLREVL